MQLHNPFFDYKRTALLPWRFPCQVGQIFVFLAEWLFATTRVTAVCSVCFICLSVFLKVALQDKADACSVVLCCCKSFRMRFACFLVSKSYLRAWPFKHFPKIAPRRVMGLLLFLEFKTQAWMPSRGLGCFLVSRLTSPRKKAAAKRHNKDEKEKGSY